MTRPTWAEISRGRLLANYRYLRHLAADKADLLPVVKADAYGHGLAHCAPLLAAEGAPWLGVTSVEEGVSARILCAAADLHPRILIMSGIWQGEAEAALEHRLTPVVWESYHLHLLESAAHKLHLEPQSIDVHLELDTGMSRQGIQAPPAVRNWEAAGESAALALLLLRFHASSPLRLAGVMTHFSEPEDTASTATADQTRRLSAALDLVIARGLTPHWLHAGNSATLLSDPMNDPGQSGLQALAKRLGARLMLRPGLALYGYAPRFLPATTQHQLAAQAALKPVLSWKSRITSMRTIAAGAGIGYNSTFRAHRTMKLALLPVGYADGLNRLLSNRGETLVRGTVAPIVGRISMDQTVIDVTGATDVTDQPGAAIGDEVVIIGSELPDARTGAKLPSPRPAAITAYDHADLAGTIPWEILCAIGPRVSRLLVD